MGEWRRAHPDLAAALETIERAQEDDRIVVMARASAPARPAPTPRPHPTAETAPVREPIDLNRATADELTRLPGIGPVLAARIIAARDARGAFESVDDLRRVAGVGAAKLAAFRDRLTVSR